MSNILQKTGTGLLIAALIFLFLKDIAVCYFILITVLIIDLYLVKKKEQTITQWYRKKFPRLVDIILTISLAGIFIYMDPVFGLFFLMGTISGHLNGDW